MHLRARTPSGTSTIRSVFRSGQIVDEAILIQPFMVLYDVHLQVEDLSQPLRAARSFQSDHVSIKFTRMVGDVDSHLCLSIAGPSDSGCWETVYWLKSSDPLADRGQLGEAAAAARRTLADTLALQAITAEEVAAKAIKVRAAENVVKALLLTRLRDVYHAASGLTVDSSLEECEAAVVEAARDHRRRCAERMLRDRKEERLPVDKLAARIPGAPVSVTLPPEGAAHGETETVYHGTFCPKGISALFLQGAPSSAVSILIPEEAEMPLVFIFDLGDSASSATVLVARKNV